MDQYSKLFELINWLLVIIPIGGITRITYCLLKYGEDEDNAQYKTRAKNVVYFIVVAECLVGLINMMMRYYFVA